MRMSCIPLLSFLVLATACDDSGGSNAGNAINAVLPGHSVITGQGGLIGEYRVASINGLPLDGEIGIALSIKGALLSFEPTCAGFVWNIGFTGDRLRTSRHRAAQGPDGMPPPVCAIAVAPEQAALARALDAVSRAERTPSNGILLSGEGSSVLLFSQ
ncbi:hypothetical protein GRI97_14560 [Altererythrobacter xixiisoli]|uniref:META domain-containing protein n=1 Tax=Croceibacterium xixiisoli TaxID=1476466 RepID=A0A6I4TWH9_9SPHN|nr:hypothetical protein [Croceibacterium xixiisoli]MXP00213.1 hypothetical protein [Croceibacterium xixiisoli]